MRQIKAMREYYDLYLWANNLYSQFAKGHGETSSSFVTLFALHENPDGVTLREIQDFVQMPKQTISSLLESLNKRGLVEQRPSQTDKRNRIFFLTDLGAEYCRSIFDDLSASENESLALMNIEDFEQMNASHRQFLGLLERKIEGGE